MALHRLLSPHLLSAGLNIKRFMYRKDTFRHTSHPLGQTTLTPSRKWTNPPWKSYPNSSTYPIHQTLAGKGVSACFILPPPKKLKWHHGKVCIILLEIHFSQKPDFMLAIGNVLRLRVFFCVCIQLPPHLSLRANRG